MEDKQVTFIFDDRYSNWVTELNKGLDEHNVYHGPNLPKLILTSMEATLLQKLKDWKYRPRWITYDYRKNLAKKLKQCGMEIQIKTNRILWLYLDYFIDLTDYSKCFDIEMVITDLEIATKDCIFINVKGVQDEETRS